MRGFTWASWLLPVALLFCLLPAPRVAAQSAKLADMPPPPSEWTPPANSSSSGSTGTSAESGSKPAAESGSQPDAGESSSKADSGESSSTPDDYTDDSTDASGRPTLRRRGSRPGEPAAAADPVVPDKPAFDPLHAQRDLDVGDFYYKKGDYDAAISRYQEATQLNPKMAKPYLLLGEVYEKKNQIPSALTAYRKYLDLYTDAPDREKVQKKIEKLQEKNGQGEPAR